MLSRLQTALIRSPGLIIGILMLLMVGGVVIVRDLPVEAVPDISPRQVLVSVVAPGLATEEVERLITLPVEASMTGIPGMTDLRSVSRSGVSVVYVQFNDATDINLDRARVEERLAQARANLPPGQLTINIGPLTTGMGEIMQFQVSGGGQSLMALNRLMNWTVAPQLRLVPGVVDVNIGGGAEETWQITLDERRLIATDVSVGDVYRAVDSNNASVGGGWIARHGEQQIVVGRGLIQNLDDFGKIPVRALSDGGVIRLRDLGHVTQGARTRLGAVTRDGTGEIVAGTILMESGASSSATLNEIEAAFPSIRKSLPPGVKLEPYYSRADLTRRTIATVRENLIIGAILVFVVLLTVIGCWRASLVIASVIPASLICAMTGMRVAGVSANLLSLGAIDFGMIVDGSLVIVEHVMALRTRTPAAPLETLVLSSMQQVARPVCLAIGVIMMVYLPILTLQGVEGKMFRPMAQTIIMALLASLLYCFICAPTLTALVLRHAPTRNGDTRIIALLRYPYQRLLSFCSIHPWIVLSFTLTLFGLSAVLATHLGGEFIPQLDEGALTVTTTRLPSASLDTVIAGVTRQEHILRRFPEVKTVISSTGTGAIPTDPMGVNETDSFIFLNDPSTWTTAHTQAGLVEAMNKALLHELPDALYSWSQPVQMRMDDLLSGVRTQVAVSIYGDDLTTLERLGTQVASVMSSVRGAADVAVEGDGDMPLLVIDVDRERAAFRNVSEQDILDTIEAIGGHIGERSVIANNAILATQVRIDKAQVNSSARIRALHVPKADHSGFVELSDVTHIHEMIGAVRINRDRVRRRMVIQSNVRQRDLNSWVAEAQQKVTRQVQLPPGYTIEWNGQFRNLQSATKRLAIVVPLTLFLVFALLTFTLGSVKAALLIFANLPLAATGGIFTLIARGLPFSISAGIGFIALFGVAILNGVVLVSAIRTRERTAPATMAIVIEAACSRFRPVMATALVASLGFVPMAFSNSAGAEVERPLASVVIGGLISSTFLTLLVLPALYTKVMGKERIHASPAD
ncbi:cobalt/zinc/cadmium resistance heavy metal efflux pump protein CzcA [Acetobacter estunensis NRIC 0472]|uniref:CusA/CzcA family heavy metal efflux RND transporter n=1 Tax=Acetobacter estunensis TaxID=104097 RepID=A0A967BEW2_9PROT|nr:CusA/CzcA family heavy metal efflux RND transporter [Acetobacter estunensis]NHO55247.1 CusA/CzcA family heavy metal efflux RND transporter [Acetobacter estunensis]GBQ27561.1 cobalt/zinc/cadmium resistance heavy metal efflux pump protein CzcA [Acetobacter estunensis NRIC 0472]